MDKEIIEFIVVFFSLILFVIVFSVVVTPESKKAHTNIYISLGSSLCDLYKSIQNTKCKIFDGIIDYQTINENILVLIYLIRVDILDKKEKYNLKDEEELSIQEIGRIPMGKAIDIVTIQLQLVATKTNLEKEYQMIMDKEDLFYKIQAKIPADTKHKN